MHIPSTGERVELRLDVDASGLLYLDRFAGRKRHVFAAERTLRGLDDRGQHAR
jgi:hypothetical protein